MARFRIKTIRTLILLPLREYVYLGLRLYQRRTHVAGLNKVPRDRAVILAGNHQNGLMDPLHILTRLHELPYFVTRADIFKNPLANAFFRYLRMLPVFRPHDGRHLMDQNKITFDYIANQLADGRIAGIFPEGTQVVGRRLMPLKKGMAHFAFDAWERGGRKDIAIVPVGLTYTSITDFRADVNIHYGNPISLNDYTPLYQQEPIRAMRVLMTDVSYALEKLMINLPAKHLDIYEDTLAWMIAARTGKQPALQPPSFRFRYEKRQITRLNALREHHPDVWAAWETALNDWKQFAGEKSIPHWLPLVKTKTPFWVMLTWPFTWYSKLIHFIPSMLINRILIRVKDPGFLSTVRFVAALIILPVWYLFLFLLIFIFWLKAWLPALLFLLSWPLACAIHLERKPYTQLSAKRRLLAMAGFKDKAELHSHWDAVHHAWEKMKRELD